MNIDVEPPYTRPIQVGSATIGGALPFVLIAGPDQIESRERAVSLAETIESQANKINVPFLFTAGVGTDADDHGFEERLDTLGEIKSRVGCPVTTAVLDTAQIAAVAETADLLRIPSELTGNSDLVLGAARTGRPVNIEKGASLAAEEVIQLLEDVAAVGNWNIVLTEQGTSVGGKRLVDISGFHRLKESGFPLIFDASHSLSSGFVPSLSMAGIAAGADGLVLEVSDSETQADNPQACPIDLLPELLSRWKGIDSALKKTGVD